ncbi:hypothetical protein LTR08_006909 [Meristemomyces frigidus]|nr:hypothetical protein LTR08_006909 [Meristemomyces frigidus]
MPTPSEVVIALPSPPVEGPPSSRASFASCPPAEEERERFAPGRARVESDSDSAGAIDEDAVEEEEEEEEGEGGEDDGDEQMMTMMAQEPTPEPELRVGADEGRGTGADGEGAHVADAASSRAARMSSPGAAPGENCALSLAQSLATAAISSVNEPLYLTFPPDRNRLPPTTTSSFLKPGAKFKGTQQSDRQVYDVQVEIKDVDLAESFLCGYLRIQGEMSFRRAHGSRSSETNVCGGANECSAAGFEGLTDDHPTLTTFFEGEIIGAKHLFKTTQPSWGSSEKVDMQHWARFPAYQALARSAHAGGGNDGGGGGGSGGGGGNWKPAGINNSTNDANDNTNTTNNPLPPHPHTAPIPPPTTNTKPSPPTPTSLYPGPPSQHPHLFMRWKEYFLVPDHRVKTITGASFEGFYYICFDQVGGAVSGIYFHAKSEKYQRLELEWVGVGGGGGGGDEGMGFGVCGFD